jgi:hypothetical protein
MPIKSEVLEVAQQGAELFILAIAYQEGDIGGAAGQLYADPIDRVARQGLAPRMILSTNDALRHLFITPEGSLWVASADGNVGTTAGVQWPAPRRADLLYRRLDGPPEWRVTSLPPLRSSGLPANITALWGTGDSDMHAGTYGGHLYHWNGRQWTQLLDGPGAGRGTIRAVRGSAPDDVYAVGANSTVLHYDGKTWRPLRLPILADEDIAVTAIRFLSEGDCLISGMADEGGVLFEGSFRGLAEFGRYPLQLVDMAGSQDRTLFATDGGVAELQGRAVTLIKTTFKTVAMFAGQQRWYFIEPAQQNPAFIDYDPTLPDKQWVRRSF